MLNPEERAALIQKAEGLRTEISDLTAQRDAARAINSVSAEDARLIAEVQGLIEKRDAAERERNEATSATDAIQLMRAAMQDRIPDEAKPEAVAAESAARVDTKAKGGKL